MPTIKITRELGQVLTALQADNQAVAHDRFTGGSDRYLICTSAHGLSHQISEETFKQLKALKLVRKCERNDPYRWWWSWYGRARCFVLSDAGKEFKLPPETIWIQQ